MTTDGAWGEQLAGRFGLHVRRVELLRVPVNDVARVEADEGTFALKRYHPGRTPAQVAWEVDLLLHVGSRGAPVALPVAGPDGYLVEAGEDDGNRCAVLFGWAEGVKPDPGLETYARLGEAAALVHDAADGFAASDDREAYGLELLVDEQLERMRPALLEARQWECTHALGERLKARLTDPALNRGLCHLDLTLDNVLDARGRLTVVDFDSAGPSWRAVEPWGVLRFSASSFRSWLTGYRSVRE